MKDRRPQPPKPGNKLYENLFEGLEYEQILKRISDGIKAAIENATRLLDDVELLLKGERYASAGFLLTTADEEMAKLYILLDMCRLDFARHENILKHLCRAFYDHVPKHAYNEIIRFSLQIWDMKHVKEIWISHITRWWPSGYESGEPDFPHDTYFERELPLYVDFIEYDQQWHIPQHDTQKYKFDKIFGSDSFSKSKSALEKIDKTAEPGFFDPKYLEILNNVFKNHFISEETETEMILSLYKKIQNQIEKDLQDAFEDCALTEWPLYPFAHISR